MRTGSATAVTALLSLLHCTQAAYTLQDDYSGANFFSKFDFFTDSDPTNGYVDYVSQSKAQSAGLINTNNGQIYMGVDSKNVASGRGRQSVRLTSKAVYNHGLILLDLEHMPGSSCGTWPAFWTVGPNWPNSGEIDIIEGVNTQSRNAATLHTGPGCSIGQTSKRAQAFTGSLQTSNCDVNAAGQAKNAGCSITASGTSTYGDGLNAVSGGVYATEWTSSAIKVWFFPRSSIPSNMNTSPDPSTWGTPLANFPSTSCNIDSVIKNQQIVFDTTFCGDWAGSVWSTDATCSSKAKTCQDYVQNNPQAFANAYWTINSLKVFSSNGQQGTSPNPSQSAGSTKSAIPSASGTMAPIPTASGSRPATSATGGIPPIVSSGKPTAAPTTFATSKPAQTTSQWPGWGQGGTRTWGGGNGGGWHRTPRALAIDERNAAAPTPTTALDYVSGAETTSNVNVGAQEEQSVRSLQRPMIRAAHTPEGVDLNMVRRHMDAHNHGHAKRHWDFTRE